ncbi:MAG: hypothetical protein PWP37_640 [Thermotogota bacterium]|nr:hypothetical protein [Thermotogota bacterium]
MKITWKLTLINTLTLLLVASVSVWIVYSFIGNFLIEDQRRELLGKLRQATTAVSRFGMMGMRLYSAQILVGLRDIYIARVDNEGVEVLWDPYDIGVLDGTKNRVEKNGRHFIVETVLMPEQGILVVAKDITALMDSIDRAFQLVIVVILVIGSMSSILAYTISSYALRPVRKMVAELRSISKERLDYRLTQPDSKDEIRELVDEINAMLGRIEEAYRSQERFVSNVSHELRTPITTILGYSKMLKRWGNSKPEILKESLDAIVETAEQMNDLVEALLTSARAEPVPTEIVSVLDIAKKLVELHRTRNPERNIRLIVECEPFVETSPHHLSIILNTFIDNAIKHTSSDVEVILHKNGVTVKDYGAGILEEEQEKIFERFYKGATASAQAQSKGHGVGLSIAKELSKVLGFEILLESELDKGSQFTLLFKDNLKSCEKMKTAETAWDRGIKEHQG